MHQIGHRQPRAQGARAAHGGGGQDAQANGLDPVFLPHHAAQVFAKAFRQTVERVGTVRRVDADMLVLGIHSDRMDRRRIDNPLHPVPPRGLPDVIGAAKVRMQDRIEIGFVGDGAEMDDHAGAFHHLQNGVEIAQIGGDPGFVWQQIALRFTDVCRHQLFGHFRHLLAQGMAQRAGRACQYDFVQHVLVL